jgi:hypothetical protein
MSDLWNDNEPCRISSKSGALHWLCNGQASEESKGIDAIMALNEGQFKKFGTNLPGANKRRTMSQWNDRANVLAAGRAGSIQATEKPKKAPSKLSQKIGGMIMGTGSSNIKTVKANRAAIDAELKKGK